MQSQFLSILISMLVDVVSCHIEHSAQSSQLVGVITQLQHIILYEVEHVLVVNIEVQVEEEWVVEDRRNDVLNDAVGAVNDWNQSALVDSREQNAFAEYSATVRNSRSTDGWAVEVGWPRNDFEIWERFVDLKL